ncbi:Nuclear transport factor family protein [Salix suchowensis]|nr:Nuclear transport factor family protein [Salix suchowensis]
MSHCCLGACLSLRKTLNHKLSLIQPNSFNARCLSSNPVVSSNVRSPIPKPIYPQLSSATKRQLNVAAKIRKDRRKLVWCGEEAPGSSSEFAPDETGMLLRKLFHAINSRSEHLLEDALSRDCFLRTSVFELQLLENRFNMYVDHEQNAKQFLRNLMKAMGPDMRFRINVTDYEQSKDDQNIATAFWHLEWDSKEIPFTRGRSVCECGEADEKILIRPRSGGDPLV